MYPFTVPTHVSLESSTGPIRTSASFCRQVSDPESILLVHGELYSLHGQTFSGPQDPIALPTLFDTLKRNPRTAWENLKGDCSCIWISEKTIQLFRASFSPHLLFFNSYSVSDQLRVLAGSSPSFSHDYLEQFVLDYPSLQFSSTLTPLKGVYRLPPASVVTLSPGVAPKIERLRTEPYHLVEGTQSLEQVSERLKNTLQTVLDWHLLKNKPVAAELSGGLDSSFVASFLADRSPTEPSAIMYAYRRHPSHLFSEQCARLVAEQKKIRLQVVDSSEIAPVNLNDKGPYQNEPVDFFWQGALFGPICRDFVKTESLLFTGFGCDQLFMRNNHILRILSKQKGLLKTLPMVKDLARSLNRPTMNFSFQFFLSRLPQASLVWLLDQTRQLKINPFKVDELLPEVLKTERVSWLLKEGKPWSALSILNSLKKGEKEEERFFEPLLPHSNLNYLLAPQYVIQPYLISKGVEYIHPFCDPRMIDFAYREVPFSLIHDFVNPYKNLLRFAMKGITPEEVRNRKRDEFSFDGYFFSFLKKNESFLRDLFEKAIVDFPGWIEPNALRSSFESMLFGVINNSEVKLSRLMSYLIWKKQFQEHVLSSQGI